MKTLLECPKDIGQRHVTEGFQMFDVLETCRHILQGDPNINVEAANNYQSVLILQFPVSKVS